MVKIFRNFFNKQTNSITVAALFVALSSLLSRLLGVFRDRILAGQFGAGQTLDIYYSAFRIPDLLFNLLILGALSAGFIPIFTGLIKDFRPNGSNGLFKFLNQEAWDLVNNLLNCLLVIFLLLSLLGIVFAPQIMNLIAPGFSLGERNLSVVLTRIMFLSPLFLGISGILSGVLQSFKNFLIYSLAPIFYNLGIIFGALYLVPIWGINGLAWGVVFGAALHMLIQLPAVWSLGWRYRPFLKWRDKNLLRIARMMIPRTLSLAVAQIDLLITTVVASTMVAGSLAIFNFANNLQSFPIGIFGISFAVAAFPVLAASINDERRLVEYFSTTVRKILFFIIPATVLIISLRAQIVRVILGTGAFNWQDTVLTMNVLAFFCWSLFAQALIPLQTRVFYAQHDSRTPFFIGLVTIALDTFLSVYLGRRIGVIGLAIAYSSSNILNFILLWLFMSKKLGDLDSVKVIKAAAKFSLASLATALVVQLSKVMIWPYINMTKLWGVLSQGLVAGILGLLVYAGCLWLFKSEELLHFFSVVSRRLPFKKAKFEDQGEVRGI